MGGLYYGQLALSRANMGGLYYGQLALSRANMGGLYYGQLALSRANMGVVYCQCPCLELVSRSHIYPMPGIFYFPGIDTR